MFVDLITITYKVCFLNISNGNIKQIHWPCQWLLYKHSRHQVQVIIFPNAAAQP